MIGTTSENAATPIAGIEHPEDLLGGVGRRREVVGGEHGERGRLAEPLVRELLGVQRRAEQPVLEPVAERLGHVDRLGPVAVRLQVLRFVSSVGSGRVTATGPVDHGASTPALVVAAS